MQKLIDFLRRDSGLTGIGGLIIISALILIIGISISVFAFGTKAIRTYADIEEILAIQPAAGLILCESQSGVNSSDNCR